MFSARGPVRLVRAYANGPTFNKERVMGGDYSQQKPQDGRGLKRRDLLLRGSSMLAASALSGSGVSSAAEAQQLPTQASGQRPGAQVAQCLQSSGPDLAWSAGVRQSG